MYYEIYIEEVFLYRFLLETAVLLFSGTVSGVQVKIKRLFTASLIAAVLYCLQTVFLGYYANYLSIMFQLGTEMIVLYVFWGNRLFLKPGRIIIRFLMAVFLTAGILQWVQKRMSGYFNISILLILIAGGCLFFFRLHKKNRVASVYLVNIYLKEEMITVPAFLDSGNTLKEPVSGKPVAILENGILHPPSDCETLKIGYHSIGMDYDEMDCVVVNYAEIIGNGMKLRIEEPCIAICHGKITKSGKYQMLLHPEMLKEEML